MTNVVLFGNPDIINARTPYVEMLAKNGIEANFSLLQSARPDHIRSAQRQLRSLASGTVVHSFDTGPNLVAGYALAEQVTPHVATITGRGQLFSGGLARRGPHQFLYDRAFAGALRASNVVFQNSLDQTYFADHVGLSGSVVLGSGVSYEQYRIPLEEERHEARDRYGIRPEQICVVLPTRLLKSKGIGTFITTAEELSKSQPGVFRFLLAGSRPEKERTLRYVGSEQLNNPAIEFIGNIEDMRSLLWATDVLFLPTQYAEGMPRVLLEAGCTGALLLATNAPGCSDVLLSGKGQILPIDATGAEFAIALSDLIRNSPDLSERSLSISEGLGLSSVAGQYAAIYRDVIS